MSCQAEVRDEEEKKEKGEAAALYFFHNAESELPARDWSLGSGLALGAALSRDIMSFCLRTRSSH